MGLPQNPPDEDFLIYLLSNFTSPLSLRHHQDNVLERLTRYSLEGPTPRQCSENRSSRVNTILPLPRTERESGFHRLEFCGIQPVSPRWQKRGPASGQGGHASPVKSKTVEGIL